MAKPKKTKPGAKAKGIKKPKKKTPADIFAKGRPSPFVAKPGPALTKKQALAVKRPDIFAKGYPTPAAAARAKKLKGKGPRGGTTHVG